ncbi:MAG: xanthine dehydrogenase family protein molybdopterin-binding subunit [Pseudomonadota bacterium]|nr:xanthine dehydrogenase family protein molybdopterin-binding subunit [Pseudomonadota bacterium]MEC8531832.1 xanthine dehydrogenase family protein molybdopterin-binding subunit [Pseudomonadota bacterium]MEC8725697.1 xanthine dehydrogenase family protein molybdopterin-binding subunit [Pseudomonadota bacterium]
MIGERLKRIEDPALLRGASVFVDDIHLAGMLQAAFLRSPHPHAKILSIDTTTAQTLSGVHAVYTLADLSPHLLMDRLPLQFPTTAFRPDVTPWILARDEVCHVGEAVAMVIADTRYIAEDAATLIDVQYDPLPSVAGCAAAFAEDAPSVHASCDENVLVRFGQSYGDVNAAFASAAHVFSERFIQHRGAAHPIEGRGALARYDALDGSTTLWSSTQMSHEVRSAIVQMFGIDEGRIRVVAPDVGGGFGSKYIAYSEEVAIALASRLLDSPVKWIEDRREHFTSAIQEREQDWTMEIAVDDDGHVLGIRGSMLSDQGAYTPQGVNMAYNASTGVPGPYIVPNYEIDVHVMETNAVAAAPVRGAGYPEGNYTMERLLDRAAQGLGLDRAEIRRRNLIPADKMPYETPLKTRAGSPVMADSGDFLKCQQIALDRIDYNGFAERQVSARAEGRYLGIGLANSLKGTGRGPFESGAVRIERSGKVRVFTGALAMGQGLKTMLAQVTSEQLGVPASEIEVVSGDTGTIALGLGGFASRQTVTAGSSVHGAAKEVRKKLLKMAAHLLEAAEEDLELADGEVRISGSDVSMTVKKIAEASSGAPGYSMPGGIEPGLEASDNFKPSALTYSNGVQAVEVEVDVGTGEVKFLNYVVVSDCGTLINPMIVDGQIAGGVVHGIGNALFEWMGYDENGQPLTTNFGEYTMPTATELIDLDLQYQHSPSPLNPLGVKGVGETGTVPAAAAIVSAVENALEPFGARINDYPIMPSKIVQLVKRAN